VNNNQPLILVVDDSTTNVVLLEAILDEKGYRIETALNAKEAYAIIAQQIPDLILLDLLMPKISGFDFLAQIRSNEKTRHTCLLFLPLPMREGCQNNGNGRTILLRND
jgi:CheY-like chemotaxis protein